MKKHLLFCIVLMVMTIQVSYAQGIGINSVGANPDNSAMLDIESHSTGSGLLIPRLQLGNAGITFNGGPAPHLLITNINAAFGAGSRFNSGIGFYRNAGTKTSPDWRRLLESSDSTLFWGTRGNAGTNPANDFIGTTDNINFIIRTASSYTGGGVTPVHGIKITVPWRPNERIIFSNVRGLELPLGSDGAPSLTFMNSNLGMYGLSGSGNSGIALRSATNLYSFFTQNGLRITTSGAPSNLLAESSMLDVDGNIFTRGKIVYNEFAAVMISASNPEKTFKNEIYWDGTIAASNDSPTFIDENGVFRIRVRRNTAGEYFLRIATTTVKNFTCVNNLGQVTIVTTTADITTFHPVNFTTEVTGPNAMQITMIREQIASAPLYRITLVAANDNVSVLVERVSN